MKIYRDYTRDSIMVCDLNSADVDKLLREYKRYSSKKGEIYDMDPNKVPSLKWFIRLTVGEMNEIGGFTWPTEYRCTNKNVARRWFDFIYPLAYHDTFNQTFRNVELEGKNVLVYSGDY